MTNAAYSTIVTLSSLSKTEIHDMILANFKDHEDSNFTVSNELIDHVLEQSQGKIEKIYL